MPIIEAKNLVKRYGEFVAVKGVDLAIEAGECFGLLGPNGAGKTTLVRMITAVSPITEGQAFVAGMDVTREPSKVKALIGVVPQEENLDPDFTVLKNLLVFARYFDIPSKEARRRAMAILEFFELAARQRAKIKELSGGMKRRLLIARALLNEPSILVLDEPTVGLDPQTKHLVWERLRTLKERGTTQLLTTQNMEEAAVLADRLAVVHEGRIVALGTPAELIARHGGREIIEAQVSSDRRETVLAELRKRGVYWQEVGRTIYIFRCDGDGLTQLSEMGLDILGRRVPTLEDVFLRLTGRALIE